MSAGPPWLRSQQLALETGRWLFGSFFRLRTQGLEHLPAGGCLVVANHPSYVDPLLMALSLPRRAGFLAHHDPWKIGSVAWWLDLFEVIPLQPGTNTAAALDRCVATIRQDRLLVVFPEGGLGAPGAVRRFHPGCAMVAHTAACPVVPAAVCGSLRAMPPGSALPRPAPVTIRFGAPLDFRRWYRRRPSARVLRGLAADMQQAVVRLYANG
ncbi:MAG: 1-acyl-sn-glycerol-3-phosphate acyltransferase [Fimbriimonadaceae bacterium]|nr:1-acyl-sn-glycerol-3-phosphate acyltransferase [Fimbriimonadaceae bacterium]